MSFQVDQAFLAIVKEKLQQRKFGIEDGALCVLVTVTALEAMVNRLYDRFSNERNHYEAACFSDRVEALADHADLSLDWDSNPWRDLVELSKARNYLAHCRADLEHKRYRDMPAEFPQLHSSHPLSRNSVQHYLDAVLKVENALQSGLQLSATSGNMEVDRTSLYQEPMHSIPMRP